MGQSRQWVIIMLALRFGTDGRNGGGMKIQSRTKYAMDRVKIKVVMALIIGQTKLIRESCIIIQRILHCAEINCVELKRTNEDCLVNDYWICMLKYRECNSIEMSFIIL